MSSTGWCSAGASANGRRSLATSPRLRSARSKITVALFSYGTLQQRDVQLATYGRALEGSPDTLVGYRLASLIISDPRVVEISGKPIHTIARETGANTD